MPGATPEPSLPAFADVLLPRRLDRPFTYAVPPALRNSLHVGSRVLVPLGAGTSDGVIVAFPAEPPRESPRLREIIKPVGGRAEDLPPELLELTRLVSDHYLAPRGQCLRLVLPATPPQRTAVRRDRWPTRVATPDHPAFPLHEQPALSTAAPGWDRFGTSIEKRCHETFLLHAASAARHQGLIHAVHLALGCGRSALIIAPETARASTFFAEARRRWGDRVALWHGGLSSGIRADLWRRIRSGAVDVVVGTRLAVFAPLASPGLLCVDEEEDPSLKEEQEPRYHAREVARMRARQHQAVLLLGSSHPSLDTMSRSEVVRLGSGASCDQAAGPAIQTVDLRNELYGARLSTAMLDGLQAALASRAGALLFLNRKGFAPAIQCRECGEALLCDGCRVSLTFYRGAGRLTCYYCRASSPVPEVCPACRAARLEPAGFGTEQLEEEVRRRFPAAKILRLDGDTARTASRAQSLRQGIAEGAADIVIGTQMLFQGPPLPQVGFVGIPHADAGLHRPDYGAAERTYHALLDAVSLARPARLGGTVVLQTYLPNHHAMAAVVNQEPSLFYEHELASRQAHGYPPFTHLISLRVSGKDKKQVEDAARTWAARLLAATAHNRGDGEGVTILGPVPAGIAQARGRHRWQLMVKSPDGERARRVVRDTLEALGQDKGKARPAAGLKFDVDVDPIEIG